MKWKRVVSIDAKERATVRCLGGLGCRTGIDVLAQDPRRKHTVERA